MSPKKTNAAKFENGATRSHHAPKYELLKGCKAGIDKLTQRLTMGSEIHGPYNWLEGGEEFETQTRRHLSEHFFNWLDGDTSDDHLAAIITNAVMLAHFEAKH